MGQRTRPIFPVSEVRNEALLMYCSCIIILRGRPKQFRLKETRSRFLDLDLQDINLLRHRSTDAKILLFIFNVQAVNIPRHFTCDLLTVRPKNPSNMEGGHNNKSQAPAQPVSHKDYAENTATQQQPAVTSQSDVKCHEHVTLTIEEKADKNQENETNKDWKVHLKHNKDENTFAINEHERNDEKNPYREGTNTFGILVRRIDSNEILPKPFQTFSQLIACAFLSTICCICIGPFAAKRAMKAKIQRDKGLFTAAKKKAKSARRCIIYALVCGVCLIILHLGLYLGGAYDDD